MPNPYSNNFYATYAEKSYRSAAAILPFVKDLISPDRIVDIGCGVGTWLSAWEAMGVREILGLDGDYVDRSALLISRDRFIAMDLSEPSCLAGAPFDLAQSLEVAEHLPSASASKFVRFLCSLAPVVLFSAAIPHQGGTNHVNEQWPEYWAALFSENGYQVFDILRSKVWNNDDVEYYYAQNVFLYVDQAKLQQYPLLHAQAPLFDRTSLSRVHPRRWEDMVNNINRTPKLEQLITAIPKSSLEFGKRAVRKLKRCI